MTWAKARPAGTTTTKAGYGKQHKKLRAQWATKIKQGGVVCWRDGLPILPGMAWELGHDDWDRGIYRGPEHKACNRKAAARKARRLQVRRKTRDLRIMDTSRQW